MRGEAKTIDRKIVPVHSKAGYVPIHKNKNGNEDVNGYEHEYVYEKRNGAVNVNEYGYVYEGQLDQSPGWAMSLFF